MPQGRYRLSEAEAPVLGTGRFRLSDAEAEAPLTRERQPAGAPSALEARHHPETLRGGPGAEALRAIDAWERPSDAAFVKRGPQAASLAAAAFSGGLSIPAQAAIIGLAGAGGELARNQAEAGPHVPTNDDLAAAGKEGALSSLLGAGPRLLSEGARKVGPVVAKHAGALSKGVGAMTGGGALLSTGNPLMALGAGSVARAMTSPRAIKAVGSVAGRAGAAIPEHAANKTGFGLLSVKALLEALAEAPASAVP